MFSLVINFANLLLAALLVGAMFGVSLVLNPTGMDAGSYVALQQQGIRRLNKPMPILGAATILFTIVAAVAASGDSRRFGLLIAGTVCFILAGLITRFLNQPINAIVITWNSNTPPAAWENLRDAWWRWHRLRMLASAVGFCLLLVAALQKSWQL
jgi:uncharacterized membrane protein